MNAPNMLLQVEIKDQYGVPVAHPANDVAKLFAGIAGTVTLTRLVLLKAEQLGFTIQRVQPDGLDSWRNQGTL